MEEVERRGAAAVLGDVGTGTPPPEKSRNPAPPRAPLLLEPAPTRSSRLAGRSVRAR
jgi:hypothetical protein